MAGRPRVVDHGSEYQDEGDPPRLEIKTSPPEPVVQCSRRGHSPRTTQGRHTSPIRKIQ